MKSVKTFLLCDVPKHITEQNTFFEYWYCLYGEEGYNHCLMPYNVGGYVDEANGNFDHYPEDEVKLFDEFDQHLITNGAERGERVYIKAYDYSF
jgi:hypothetical protein